MKNELTENREAIATLGGYKKITNFPPDVWDNGKRKIMSLSFDKPNMYAVLMEIVSDVEQEQNLIIEIKRYECIIKEMHLTANRTLIHVDGVTSKQRAVFEALAKYAAEFLPTPLTHSETKGK